MLKTAGTWTESLVSAPELEDQFYLF